MERWIDFDDSGKLIDEVSLTDINFTNLNKDIKTFIVDYDYKNNDKDFSKHNAECILIGIELNKSKGHNSSMMTISNDFNISKLQSILDQYPALNDSLPQLYVYTSSTDCV